MGGQVLGLPLLFSLFLHEFKNKVYAICIQFIGAIWEKSTF